jgi:site-specific DNA-cytosine methylase
VVIPWVEHWISDPVHVTEQLATITARLRHTLASIEPSDHPITDEQLMGVRFRMLEPDPELRRAMAFEDDYVLLGNKGEMTAGLGNAVTPPVAGWITARCLDTLR